MKYLILPVLHALNVIYAYLCGAFCFPFLLLWHLRWTPACQGMETVFLGILEGNPEVYCPAAILTLMLSPLWLLEPLLYFHVLK